MDELTDDEFDLIDELYFVQHFKVIRDNLNWTDEQLTKTLMQLIEKDNVKALSDHDTEYPNILNIEFNTIPWNELYFLATKKGLMLHNGF